MFTRCIHCVTYIAEILSCDAAQNIFHDDEMIFMFPEKKIEMILQKYFRGSDKLLESIAEIYHCDGVSNTDSRM